MKNFTLALLLLVSGFSYGQIFTTPECSIPLGTNTYGPMYSVATANATSRTAIIYPVSQLTGIIGQELTSIYFSRVTATGSMSGNPNLRIYLMEVPSTDWGAGALDWATATAGATLVYEGNPAGPTGSTAGWKSFPFSTNFTYSGTQNLAMFTEYRNLEASTSMTWNYEYTNPCIDTGNNNTTKYSNNITATVPATLGSSNYRRPLIGFDFTVSCPAPTAFASANVTAFDVDLSWTAGGAETSWEYAVVPASSPAPTSGTIVSAAEAIDVAVSPATDYVAYLRAVCGTDDESIWVTTTFTTPCVAITTLPWSENFDGLATVGTNSFPPCWTEENGDWASNSGTTYNTPRSGANYLRNSWNALDEYMWTPAFELQAGTSYDFSTFVQGDNYTGWVVDMFYNTSASATGATQLGASYNVPGSSPTGPAQVIQPYVEMRRTFVPTTTGTYYFGLRVNQPSTAAWYVAFDDFVLELTPDCAAPTELEATNITDDSANLEWTEAGDATEWNIEYGITGFTPGAGTIVNNVTSPHFIDGLDGNTSYSFYVQSDCGDSESAWAGPMLFTTLCAPITTLPWTENFDALTGLGTNTFPPCWSKENGDWSTSSATTYNTAYSGSNYLRIYYLATDEYMWTPGFDLEAGTSYDLSTFVQGDNHTGWVVDMFYNTDQTSTGATQLGAGYTIPGTGSTAIVSYNEMRRTFVPTTSGVYYFAVRVNSTNTASWYVAFDDFSLQLTPDCAVPSSLTSTSVTSTSAVLGWTDSNSGSSWDIEYGPAGFTPGTGTVITVTTNPYTLTGLTPETAYEFYVQSECAGTVSDWSAVSAFTTLAVPPANDNCDAAVSLTVNPDLLCGSVTSGTTVGATESMAATPCYGNPDDDVWFSFVATATAHQIVISNVVAVTGTSTDMYMQILSGACGTLTSVQCSDPNTMDTTGLTVGNTYYVRVYSYYATARQTFNICVGTPPPPPPPPANDNCDAAVSLTVNPDYLCGAVTAGTTGGATESMAATPCSGNPDDDVWFSFVATATAHRIAISDVVNVSGTSTDMYMQLLSGACGTLTSVQCSDPNTMNSTGLTVGSTYYVRVYTFGTTSRTNFNICVGTEPPPQPAPVNDNCDGAVSLTVNPDYLCGVVTAGTTAGATESMAATPCSGNPDDDVWFSFVATNTAHRIALSNVVAFTGTSTDMYMQILSGTCGTLTSVQCSDPNTMNVSGLTVGSTYYVRVYTFSTTSRTNFNICVGTPPPPPSNDDCANATALTAGGVYADNVVDASSAGATTSSEPTPTTCFGFSGGDVWFTAVVPASGSLTIETGNPTVGTGVDTVITAYSGTCGALTQISCDDDGAATGAYSLLTVSGQVPGSTIYVRVYEYGNDNEGPFAISAYDSSLSTDTFTIDAFDYYPNPVKDVLRVKHSGIISAISVFNVLGQQVIIQNINATESSVDMSALPSGTYIVKATADGVSKTFKVVKQ
ncbi:MAG: fibronectin type III domain-containing protein [Flavobacterium sp.]|nr:fibronectin type III domain-containing protein [Flavobacterium sp.]